MDEYPAVVEECECAPRKKEEKGTYLALFHNAETGAIEYLEARTAVQLRKYLEPIALTQIIMIWKGRKKPVETKQILAF